MKFPRVHRVTSRGSVYKYHRHTRVELPNDVPENHPKFIAAWSAEDQKKPEPKSRAKSGSIEAGCETYLKSGSYSDLTDSYRPIIRRHVEAIREARGKAPMAGLRSYHINADLDPLTPAVARSRLKAWRKLCGFWTGQGIIPDDVSRAAVGKKMPKSEGHKEWTRDDLRIFRDHWPVRTPQRHACELLQWTGARCVDVVKLGRGMIDRDGLLSFRQQKTHAMAHIPWTCPALGLESERETLLSYQSTHMVFLTTVHGKPRSHKSFSQWFSAACTEAGLPGLAAHGLRKYRMNELSENGATVLQMQAWVGHTTLNEVEAYTRKAQRRTAFLGTEQDQNPVKQSKTDRKH